MPDESRLNELMDRWEALRERGASPTVEQVCLDCPELADDLRRWVADFGEIDAMLAVGAEPTAAARPGSAPAAVPEVEPAVSPYGRLRLHARGGLGEVFRAHDERLNRDVALKVIRAARAGSPDGCRRFERESEITGLLEHPGVAPVYASGRCRDDRPYYAMRFIEGETLRDAIRRHHEGGPEGRGASLAFRGLLTRFVQVCNTIEYAHGRGVLHRDIKPANVMLGPYGETLVVDWGLAKVLDEPDAGDEPRGSTDPALSAAGSALGTPAFMAPEQVDGDPARLGPRTDVYGLGATLYCLLTGRPPFEEDDIAVIHERVVRGDFRRPVQVKPGVSRALEAVCLKAMALRPEGRYAGAGALAEELERWLADEPLRAYRDGWGRRSARWARRHRSIAVVSLLALITTVVALTITSVQVSRAHAVTEASRKRAVAYGFMTLQGITEPLKRLGNPDLERQPELAKMRRGVLDQAIEAYETFVDSRGREPGEPTEVINCLIHLGLVHTIGGDRDGAVASYTRAIRLGDGLLAKGESGSGLLDAVGMANWHLGMELKERGDEAEAERHFRAADLHFVRALGIEPDLLIVRQHLAWLLIFGADDPSRSPAHAVEAARRLVEMPQAEGRDRATFSEGIRPRFTEGLAYYRAKQTAAARAALEESIRRRGGGDAYEGFAMALVAAREGGRDAALRSYRDAVEWTKWNRYGDTELHQLEAEAADALGLRSAFDGMTRAERLGRRRKR